MSSPSKQPRSGQTSIKYRCNPIKAPPSELAGIVHEKYACPHSNDNKQNNKNSEPNSEKILSTTELISAVDKIWNRASHLHIFHPKADGINDHSGYKKEILGNLGKEENGITRLFADEVYLSVDVSSSGQLASLVKPKLEFPKVTRKLLAIDSCSERYTPSTFSRFLQGCLPSETFSVRGLVNEGIYQWMTDISPSPLKFTENSLEAENTTADKHGIPGGTIASSGHSILGDRHNLATGQGSNHIGCYLDSIKSDECSSCCSSDKVMNVGNTRSLHSDYFLRDDYDTVIDNSRSRTLHSSLYADYSMDSVASCNITYDKFQHLNDSDVLLENRRRQPEKFSIEDEKGTELGSLQREKHQFSFAKQEHAFAGAMAGVFVSLCLHPVDTIKTVVQSCNAGNESVCHIGKSIVSERGLPGLYRGIASNIASSAPISAVYTFTYESVKGALLPHFPKEFHSLAHCIAGGSASIATSFIFTPSERIKQQMQVGSHYHNCWNALVGILGKGGLPSLYAGWGAVLCRNVPHSIIKFYTYESLKQIMLPSLGSSAQPNTLQMLVCGGLAGSTAALFTTPFDVVKTRLQTQIPGSLNRYDNVYHALGEIGRNEGLRGLYRGLIPRLVMYMSQGALFFASYEFFKSLFSLEVSRLNAARIQCKQNEEDAQLTQ